MSTRIVNFIEASTGTRRFRRVGGINIDWISPLSNGGTTGSYSKDYLLADFELEETPISLTEAQFTEAWDKMSQACDYVCSHESSAAYDDLKRELFKTHS